MRSNLLATPPVIQDTPAVLEQRDYVLLTLASTLLILVAVRLANSDIGKLLYRRITQIFYTPPPLPIQLFNKDQVDPARSAIVFSIPVISNIMQHTHSLKDMLSLSAVNKDAFEVRFYSGYFQTKGLRFKSNKEVERFCFYCRNLEQAEPGTRIRTLSDLEAIKTLALNLSDKLNVDKCKGLFRYLSGIDKLEIRIDEIDSRNIAPLAGLLKALQPLHLKHLSIIGSKSNDTSMPLHLLPDELWELTTLHTLELIGLKKIITHIPDKIAALTNLTTLKLVNMPQLTALPDSIGQLKQLTRLELVKLPHITAFSGNVTPLSDLLKVLQPLHLKHLRIIDPKSNDFPMPSNLLPDELWELTALNTLELVGLKGIEQISNKIADLTNLTTLKLVNMPLTALPDSIGQLKRLIRLELVNLPQLVALPDTIGELPALTSLIIDSVAIKSLPTGLSTLPALQHFTLSRMTQLTHIPEDIGGLQSLLSLEFTYLARISVLPDSLWELPALEKLTLKGLPALTEIPENIDHLLALTSLKIAAIPVLTLPRSLWQIKALKKLELKDLTKLRKIPKEIEKLQTLVSLKLESLGGDGGIPLPRALFLLNNLEELALVDLNINYISSINDLTRLKILTLGNLGLYNLPENLWELKNLERLILDSLPCDISAKIAQLQTLVSLELNFMEAVKSLPRELSTINTLKEIKISNMTGVRVPSALKGLVKIR
jgi:Leucine-rich repeat (LRR) protein